MKISKITSLLAAAGAASAASLQQVSNFGTNPTGVQMCVLP